MDTDESREQEGEIEIDDDEKRRYGGERGGRRQQR
jgi:hypothetical protein